jgi:hypothetical protein
MKKTVLLFLAVIGMMACSGDDGNRTVATNEPVAITQSNLEGEWKYNAYYLDGVRQGTDACTLEGAFKFEGNTLRTTNGNINADGQCVIRTANWTYIVSGNTLTATGSTPTDVFQVNIQKLTGTTLSLSEDASVVVYERVSQ